MSKSYSEKLKDPRWQRKRLEVMQKNGFKCQSCDSSTKTLHVHHKRYRKVDPWDYHFEELFCLCEDCHNSIHGLIERIEKWLPDLFPRHLEQILKLCESFFKEDLDPELGREASTEELDEFFGNLKGLLDEP